MGKQIFKRIHINFGETDFQNHVMSWSQKKPYAEGGGKKLKMMRFSNGIFQSLDPSGNEQKSWSQKNTLR